MVRARWHGFRGASFAALPVGAGERFRATALRAAPSWQGNRAVRRRGASIRVFKSARGLRRWRGRRDRLPMITERVSYEQLLGISGCLALALLAHVTTLPFWVPAIVVACGLIRLSLARSGRGAPPRTVLFIIAALVIPLLFLRFHTFNGLVAGTALLSVTAGLKLVETKTRRDIYIITLIIYFVSLAALLEGDSFWLLAYLIGVCWLTTATLLRLTSSGHAPGWRRSLHYGGRVLAQALPLALVFWLLFPRFAQPLWHIPNDSQTAASGVGDTMSPGDINHLALSDEVAFAVGFTPAAPPPQERYWRGPVLDSFDGHTWTRARTGVSG